MKTIHLHGALAKQFGESFSLDVRDPAEAVRALSIQLPGFDAAIRAGDWHVIRGSLEDGESLSENDLTVGLGAAGELHLMPAVAGAGGDGIFQTIAGVVIAAVGFYTKQGWMVKAGVGLALGGASQMLAPSPQVSDYGNRERPDQRPSFLFDGPVNTSTQGLPVPLVYGRVRAGSVVISAGMNAEEL
ncbi:tail assembly protein [Halomonas smyrnensis]|uniref:tail assembly protein n=1 Tax=Halomonas smyrnensis TaxID=720605 RepID=UPI000320052B|nr:tail assembly protein [Halomonas smyrnensis]